MAKRKKETPESEPQDDPRGAQNRTLKRTRAAQDRFLDAFVETATVVHAAEVAGVGRRTHYDWLDSDDEYAARFAQAEEDATQRLEREARRRAVEGTREPVGFYKGEPGGYVRRYSDNLLMFLLKARRPAVYRERYEHRHVGDDGGPVRIQRIERVIVDPTKPGAEEGATDDD